MGIWNKTKKSDPFCENTNFIGKLTFPNVLDKTKNPYTTAILIVAEVLCFIMIQFYQVLVAI